MCIQKNKPHNYAVCLLFGGREWIRTIEVEDNRFTVCPLWPLGNSPVLELVMGLEPATC